MSVSFGMTVGDIVARKSVNKKTDDGSLVSRCCGTNGTCASQQVEKV